MRRKLCLLEVWKGLWVFLAFFVLGFLSGCKDEDIKLFFKEYEKSGGDIGRIKKIAILNFSGQDEDMNLDITHMVYEAFASSGYFEVLDLVNTSTLLQSEGFRNSGDISPQEAEEIAKALKVDGIVYGKVSFSFVNRIKREYDSYPYPYDRDKKTRVIIRYVPYRRYLERQGWIKIEMHFYDAILNKECGKVLLSRGYYKKYRRFYRWGNSDSTFYFDSFGSKPMLSGRDILLNMAHNVIWDMMKKFLPYYIEKSRKLEENVSGYYKALDGKWDEAYKIWKSSIIGNSTDWRLYTNMGIYWEIKQNPARAVFYYRKALSLNPENLKVQRYLEEAEKAKEAKMANTPLAVLPEDAPFRVASVKGDMIYINAGEEDVKEGDLFLVARKKLFYSSKPDAPKKYRLYPVGVIKITKVYEGVSKGCVVKSYLGQYPKFGDSVFKKLRN